MALVYTEKPRWLVNAVAARNRRLIGARKEDLDNFKKKIIVTLLNIEPFTEIGRNIVDINTKEFCNNSDKEDKYVIRTEKTSSMTTAKNYELMLGKSKKFGGDFGIGITSSFFNIGAGVSASREKYEENTAGVNTSESLSQEYGVVLDTVLIPPHSKVHIEIWTYAVTYSARVRVKFSAPKSNFLNVKVKATGCCGGTHLFYITASEFLRQLDSNNAVTPVIEEEGWVYIEIDTEVQYIGEATKIKKTVNKL